MRLLSKLTLLALAATLAAALFAASASATPATENCDEDVSVTGAGSTLQDDAQTLWKGVFNGASEGEPYCDEHFPAAAVIGYDSIDSTAGRTRFENRAPASGAGAAAWWSTDQAPNATRLHDIEEEGPSSPADEGETVTIPVAGQAIAVILNVPDACIGTMTGLDEHGRVEVTNTDIEAAYHGTITTWAALVDTNSMACAETPIDPIARKDSSGTTFQFKGWLFTKFSGTVMTSPNRTWQDLQDSSTTWPADVEKAASDGGPALASAVASTDGAIGYVAVSDARDGGFWMSSTSDDKYWTEVQTPESTWVDPATNEESSTDGSANCGSASYTGVPAAGHSENDWATVTGFNTDVDTVYSICALTYVVAWADATTAAGHTLNEACTVRHYVGYALQEGQTGLSGIDYSPLPGGLLTVAEANQEEIAETLECPVDPDPAIEATNEASGIHCSAVSLSGTDVNGGCLTHATGNGNVELRKHTFGIESHITSCTNEFAGRISEEVTGYIFEQVLAGAGCSRQACAVDNAHGEKAPWTVVAFEGTGQGVSEGTEYLTTTFCLEPREGVTDETCEIDIPFQTYESQHRQEYGHASEMSSHGVSGFRCELVGHWNTETGGTHDGDSEQEITIAHT